MKGMFLEACTKRQHKDRIVNTGHLIVHPTKTQALLIHGSVGFHFNRIIRCKLGNGQKKRWGVRGYLGHGETISSLPPQTWAISKGANALTCVCLVNMAFLRQDWKISEWKWEIDELTLGGGHGITPPCPVYSTTGWEQRSFCFTWQHISGV